MSATIVFAEASAEGECCVCLSESTKIVFSTCCWLDGDGVTIRGHHICTACKDEMRRNDLSQCPSCRSCVVREVHKRRGGDADTWPTFEEVMAKLRIDESAVGSWLTLDSADDDRRARDDRADDADQRFDDLSRVIDDLSRDTDDLIREMNRDIDACRRETDDVTREFAETRRQIDALSASMHRWDNGAARRATAKK